MSIYMVQHEFSKPEWLIEWNNWYANNLKVFMTIPGIFTAQRFQAVNSFTPRFMAVYTVDPLVFESKIYKDSGGGGKASERFQPAYSVWVRNLFEGLSEVPAVNDDQLLVIKDMDHHNYSDLGCKILRCTGLHQTTPYRGLKVISNLELEEFSLNEQFNIYRPISIQFKPV